MSDATRELTYAFHALRMQQLLFETFPRRNILENRDEVVELPHRVSRHRERPVHPDLRPVLVQKALFPGERPDLAGEELSNARLVEGEIIAMGDGEEGAGQELVACISENVTAPLVDPQPPPVHGRVGDAHRGLLEGRPEALLRITERVVDLLLRLVQGGRYLAEHVIPRTAASAA